MNETTGQGPGRAGTGPARRAASAGTERYYVILQGYHASVETLTDHPDLTVQRGERRKRVLRVYASKADADSYAADFNSAALLPMPARS